MTISDNCAFFYGIFSILHLFTCKDMCYISLLLSKPSGL